MIHRSILIGLITGMLQFGLACYAFRFARHLGKPRVGWPLFITLSLLAACTPLLSMKLHFEHIASASGLNILYAASSFVLFIGLVRFDMSLRKYRRTDPWEARNEIDELSRANGELRLRADGLEREMSEQNEAHKRLESAYKDLVISIGSRMPVVTEHAQPVLNLHAQADPQPQPIPQPDRTPQPAPTPEPILISQPEPEAQPEAVPQLEVKLEPETTPEPELQQPLPAIRLPEEIGRREEISILVSNVSASVASLAERLVRLEAANANLARFAKLMNAHGRTLGSFMTSDLRGRQLPASLSQLSKQLAEEQSLFIKQIGSIKKRLAQISMALTVDSPVAPEHDPSPSSFEVANGEEQFHYSLHAGQTETAVSTETQPGDSSETTVSASLDGELDETNVFSDAQDELD